MERDFSRLRHGTFDLLVIGGGIYGAWIAYDASLRNLKVALVEKKDWAGGTSSASSKLIHGGLRYLEYFHLGLVKKSLKEREHMMVLAPHRIRPMRFVIPVYKGDRVGRLRLNIGLSLYDILAGTKKRGEEHCAYGKAEILRNWSFLSDKNLLGGFTYRDGQTDDARLTLEIVDGALQAGVAAVNHAEAVKLLYFAGRIVGALIEDQVTGEKVELRASVTVNAAGPWGTGLLGPIKNKTRLMSLTKGVHLLMPPLPGNNEAFLLMARSDGRFFFLIPWYGLTMIGTTDTYYTEDPDALKVDTRDVEYLLSETNRILGKNKWSESDIRGSFAGLRTLRSFPKRPPSAISRECLLAEPVKNLLMPIGGKLTAARIDAARTVDRIMSLLNKPTGPCPTTNRPFPWSPVGEFQTWSEEAVHEGVNLGLDVETATLSLFRFGSKVKDLHAILRTSPSLATRVDLALPFSQAEIVHAVKYEMARSLEDVFRRRLPLAILSALKKETITTGADLIGDILNWSPEHKAREIASFRQFLGRC